MPVTPYDCEKCGKVHPRGCRGHISTGERAGEPCERLPWWGGKVCGAHGGAAKQVKAAGLARKEIRKAEEAMQETSRKAKGIGLSAIDGDWVGALKLALARQRDLEEMLMARIRDDTVTAPNLDAYRITLRDLRDTAAVMARIDLDAVEIRIEAEQLAIVERSLRAACEALGVDEEDYRAIALPAMAAELRRE